MNASATKKKANFIKASMDLPMRVGMGRVDDKVIERAQKVLDETEVEFGQVAKDDLNVLKQSIETSKTSVESVPRDKMVTSIMNLKANAGSFHFSLISDIGGLVLSAIEKSPALNKEIMDIVAVLYQSIHLIIGDDMRGNGGKEGRDLGIAFRELCGNYEKKLSV